ncbi:MAG TPA: hypothetical protein ENJ95_24055 [Bacteroidetes bacterium]|nr:hypothetical protein [Bacteroidota bacterium]
MKTYITPIILFLSIGCSPKITEQIKYKNGYNNFNKIEQSIKGHGAAITYSKGEPKNSGTIKINDSSASHSNRGTIFTFVKKEKYSEDEIIIINEALTNEGIFRLSTIINGDRQTTEFEIVKSWENRINFSTKKSKLKMSKPINSKETTSFKLQYIGIEKGGNRKIKLRNEFYLFADIN